jgi:3-carboxy-cis,cis-muconate cycloisomerase
LQVDPAQMLHNLDITHGLIMAEAVTMALGAQIGRLPAHHLVEDACRRAIAQGAHLRDVLLSDGEVGKHLSPADIERLLDPANYVGLSGEFVDRALSAAASTATPER